MSRKKKKLFLPYRNFLIFYKYIYAKSAKKIADPKICDHSIHYFQNFPCCA